MSSQDEELTKLMYAIGVDDFNLSDQGDELVFTIKGVSFTISSCAEFVESNLWFEADGL